MTIDPSYLTKLYQQVSIIDLVYSSSSENGSRLSNCSISANSKNGSRPSICSIFPTLKMYLDHSSASFFQLRYNFLVNLGWIWAVDLKIKRELGRQSIKLFQLLQPPLEHKFQPSKSNLALQPANLHPWSPLRWFWGKFQPKLLMNFWDLTLFSWFSPNSSKIQNM